MQRKENWKDHLGDRYRQMLVVIAEDHGEGLSRAVMGVAFHTLAEIALKRVTAGHYHGEIERTFGIGVAMIPGNRYHDARKAADSLAMPLLRSLDNLAGAPLKHSAAWVEQQLLEFEQRYGEWIGRNW